MDVSYMRQYIKDAYGRSESWCKKVNKMGNNQVIAIYYSLLNRAKKKESPKEEKPEPFHQVTLQEYKKEVEEKPKEMVFHQITMDEYLRGLA